MADSSDVKHCVSPLRTRAQVGLGIVGGLAVGLLAGMTLGGSSMQEVKAALSLYRQAESDAEYYKQQYASEKSLADAAAARPHDVEIPGPPTAGAAASAPPIGVNSYELEEAQAAQAQAQASAALARTRREMSGSGRAFGQGIGHRHG